MDTGAAYRDRSVKYGRGVKRFDELASAQDMQDCADSLRRRYNDPNLPEWEKPGRLKAEAAYCQSLAERKAAGR